ncbi:MAG: transcription elongation factor GreA [Chloroflexi bacterium]|nr:transcription elongation factor GreA [Chloroflexota bacterium]
MSQQEQKNYLTREGHQELVRELEYLTSIRRREVAEHIRQAKADGDITENVAYSEAKEEQAFLEGRIQTLELLLQSAVVVDDDEQPSDGRVRFGCRVTVLGQDSDAPETYQLVGSAEADPMDGKLSAESPLGKALIGRRVGDEVTVQAPGGGLRFRVVDCE